MSYASEVLADTPVAWYRLSDASGNVQDSSGNARHGSSVNGAPTYGQPGGIPSDPSNNSMQFHTAGGDCCFIAANAAFEVGDTYSVEGWIKRADSSTAEINLFVHDSGFYLGLDNNQLFAARTSVAGIAHSTVSITDTTTWHYLVITKTGATVKQYIDAVDVTGTITNSTSANVGADVRIGSDAGGNPYNGLLDEVALYSTVLSPARVLAHYNAALLVAMNYIPVREEAIPTRFGPF